jgi:hypothetical protein
MSTAQATGRVEAFLADGTMVEIREVGPDDVDAVQGGRPVRRAGSDTIHPGPVPGAAAAPLLDQVMLTAARAPSTDRDGNAGELPGSRTLRTAPTGGRRLHLAATGNASRLHRSRFSSDQRRMTCLAR